MKVSFDFDNTLSRSAIQEYAKTLLHREVEVWVCTSRMKDPDSSINSLHIITKGWNDDLYAITDNLCIPISRVLFSEMLDKVEILQNYDFIWHLDDDWIEIDTINRAKINTRGVKCIGEDWIKECEKLLFC